MLRKRGLIRLRKIFQIPKWAKLEPLLRGGAALQLRSVALNVSFLAVARVTQSIDQTGVAAAAHAMAIQVFQVGGIVLLALSTVSQTMIPNDLVARFDKKLKKRVGGKIYAKATVNRLMCWGFLLGIGLGSLQILLLPLIGQSTPIKQVRDAARIPAFLASIYQIMNGLVFIGEGVMVGTGSFLQLSLSTIVATASGVLPVGPVNESRIINRTASPISVRCSAPNAAGRLRSDSITFVFTELGSSTLTPIGDVSICSSCCNVSEIDTTATFVAA